MQMRRATDLSVLLQEAYHLRAASKADAEAAAAKLGGAELLIQEEAKDQVRRKRLAEATATLINGPVLRLPGPFNVQFNPSNTEVLDDGSSFHPTATFSGAWGKLVVTGGSLRTADWSEARVAAPTGATEGPLSGLGWNLELVPGWVLAATEPAGSWKPVKIAGAGKTF
jgi:hypothetical protein